MSARRILVLLALFCGAMLPGCSKKSSNPTAPPENLPICGLSTTTLSFGSVEVGLDATLEFTLSNSGAGTLSGNVVDTSTAFTVVGDASYNQREHDIRWEGGGSRAR